MGWLADKREKAKDFRAGFMVGLRGEERGAAGRPATDAGAAATVADDGRADPDGPFSLYHAGVGVVASVPYALAFGLVIAGSGIPILPWGSRLGYALVVVALIATSFWNGFPEKSDRRNTAITAGYTVVLFAHVLSRGRFGYHASVLLNGFLLAMLNKELNRPRVAAYQRLAAGVAAVFPLLVTFGAVFRDDKPLPFSGSSPTFGNAVSDVLRVYLVLGLMQLTARQFRTQERERERMKELEAERDEAILNERTRIARELHDVVAHHVSVMTIQAEGARELLPDRPGKAVTVLDQISETGRSALTELRRMLGVLRAGDGAEGPEREPQPGADALEALVAGTTAAGLPTTLTTEGEVRPLPAGVELSIYRVVQEALTNALKHAGEARATVRLVYGTDAVDVSIVDDGAGAAARTPGGGHGLIGMRERVELLGGEFDAGPRRSGGFEVSVRLPVTDDAVATS